MSGATVSKTLASFNPEKMEEGNSYLIASSEILLGEPIQPKVFLSGQCFVGDASATTPVAAAMTAKPQAPVTPFMKLKASSGARLANSSVSDAAAAQQQAALLAMLEDPSLLLLNRSGILDRSEKAVYVDMFLSKQLRQHQREGVQWMYNAVMGISSHGYEGCILADSMGLGKTLQVRGEGNRRSDCEFRWAELTPATCLSPCACCSPSRSCTLC